MLNRFAQVKQLRVRALPIVALVCLYQYNGIVILFVGCMENLYRKRKQKKRSDEMIPWQAFVAKSS